MSNVAKIKTELDDTASMVEIFQILKDVATNHFYNAMKRMGEFSKFTESFAGFFSMISFAGATSPLVHPSSKKTGIVAVTSEGGFMADMTAKVLKAVVIESQKHEENEVIFIGSKGRDKFRDMTHRTGGFCVSDIEEKGLYNTAVETKNYIVEKVKEGSLGKIVAVYPKAASVDLIKQISVKLLPSEDLFPDMAGQDNPDGKVILESELDDIIGQLADIWLTHRIQKMLEECAIAGFAAQAQQLESSLERLKKEHKTLVSKYRKAKKDSIDQSLREVFTAAKIMQNAQKNKS